jgi:PKD repeat protein
VSPQNPGALETVTFDASGTTDEGETCAAACTYVWTMGDGTTKTGKIITHIFSAPGAYTVVLTVTDAVGTTATRQLVLVVGSVAAPSISALAVAPDPVEVGKQATLTATATAATGHAIARYAWSFGDGTTATTTSPTANKTWESPGVYVVTVTATDDLGQSSSRSLQVSVRNVPAPTVTLSVTPNPPLAGQQATFLANASPAAGHSITKYEWTFGDGTSQTTTVPSVTKTYTTQGVYVVTVTVTDDSGQTGSVSQQMNIANSAVNATISYSPKDPVLGQSVIFTALNPTAPNGATITSYEWNFGDPGSGSNEQTGRTVAHTFSSANTFVVQLKVTDSGGGIGIVTIEVSVTAPSGP